MEKDNLRGFEAHGIIFSGTSGNQATGTCIFCEKQKFYVNTENRLWDCKVCGAHGNFEDFLGRIAETYREQISSKLLEGLARDRQIPAEAFRGLKIGWDGRQYQLPVWSATGRVIDIRRYSLGKKLMSTPTGSLGLLFLAELLDKNRADEIVYLCEGEWDATALRWLFRSLGVKGVVVGTPGANVFKTDWAVHFQNRRVHVLFDNDQAGIDGEIRVLEALNGIAKSVEFLHWDDGLPTGYDIRDLVVLAIKEDELERVPTYVKKHIGANPRSKAIATPSGDANVSVSETADDSEEKLKPISLENLIAEYRKWLHLPNSDVLKILYGTLIANRLGGDPVWMFLVAPPGGSKSELLMSLSSSSSVHALTSLTPHTLISGAKWGDGKDPSLLPQLDGKMLVIKDFTTILTMHYSVRDEIFGVLRDIYDGSTEKMFGNGIRRTYDVHFGVLAGVTPVIETFNIMHSSLGERFLKFRITGNWDAGSESTKIRRALSNIGNEIKMRDGLKVAAKRYISNLSIPEKLPEIPDTIIDATVCLAKFCARLRGVVERDKYTQHLMYKPSSEVGTRIAKQLAKLGSGIAIFLEKEKLDWEVYKLMRRVALDTVPDRSEDVVRALWKLKGEAEDYTGTTELVNYTRMPQSTVFRILQDLNLLKLVDKEADNSTKSQWRLNLKVRDLIVVGRIYDEEFDKKKNKISVKIKE